jgi:hypothetical protein
MTELEWLEATNPTPMLKFLQGRATERKLRLFACCCCYRLHELTELEEERLHAVECAELYADGKASSADLASAKSQLWGYELLGKAQAVEGASDSALSIPLGDVSVAARAVVHCCTYDRHYWTASEREADEKAERALQADVLRDLFGNPFRPVTIDMAWRTPTTVGLAQTIYDTRRYEILPILADALEEAGCTDPNFLTHLRCQEQIHIRGCWVIDLLLSKK